MELGSGGPEGTAQVQLSCPGNTGSKASTCALGHCSLSSQGCQPSSPPQHQATTCRRPRPALRGSRPCPCSRGPDPCFPRPARLWLASGLPPASSLSAPGSPDSSQSPAAGARPRTQGFQICPAVPRGLGPLLPPGEEHSPGSLHPLSTGWLSLTSRLGAPPAGLAPPPSHRTGRTQLISRTSLTLWEQNLLSWGALFTGAEGSRSHFLLTVALAQAPRCSLSD